MRYYSRENGREKEYEAHPHRLVHAQGGLYLIAFVPAYAEVRTFAVERMRSAPSCRSRRSTRSPSSTRIRSRTRSASIGGPAMKVQLRFHRSIAASIKERTWHGSQQLKDRSDGSVVMTLQVSDDYALRSWILGFGRFVQVLRPPELVAWMEEELEAARRQYGTDGVPVAGDGQLPLPFWFAPLSTT